MLDAPSNKNLPQPEIQGSYIRDFTVYQKTLAKNTNALENRMRAAVIFYLFSLFPNACGVT